MTTNIWRCAMAGLLCAAGAATCWAEFGGGGKLGGGSEPKPVEKPALFDPKIDELYRQAVGLFRARRFDQAEAICQKILAMRPEERNTLQLLREITETRQRIPAVDTGAAMKRRLAAVILPELKADRAVVRDFVVYLQDLSAKFTDDKKPVNVVWNVPESVKVPEATFNLFQVSLAEALKLLADSSGLRCRYDENAVVIHAGAAATASDDAAEDRSPLRRKLQETIVAEYQVTDAAAMDAQSHLQTLIGKAAADKTPVGIVWNVPASETLPTVSLRLYRISALDALKYFAEVTGLRFRVEERAVVITATGSAPAPK